MTRVLIGKGLLSWKVGSLKIEDISRDSRYIPSYPTPWPCGNPDPLHLIPSKLPRLQCLHGRGRLATCLGFSSDHATGGPSRGEHLGAVRGWSGWQKGKLQENPEHLCTPTNKTLKLHMEAPGVENICLDFVPRVKADRKLIAFRPWNSHQWSSTSSIQQKYPLMEGNISACVREHVLRT